MKFSSNRIHIIHFVALFHRLENIHVSYQSHTVTEPMTIDRSGWIHGDDDHTRVLFEMNTVKGLCAFVNIYGLKGAVFVSRPNANDGKTEKGN